MNESQENNRPEPITLSTEEVEELCKFVRNSLTILALGIFAGYVLSNYNFVWGGIVLMLCLAFLPTFAFDLSRFVGWTVIHPRLMLFWFLAFIWFAIMIGISPFVR